MRFLEKLFMILQMRGGREFFCCQSWSHVTKAFLIYLWLCDTANWLFVCSWDLHTFSSRPSKFCILIFLMGWGILMRKAAVVSCYVGYKYHIWHDQLRNSLIVIPTWTGKQKFGNDLHFLKDVCKVVTALHCDDDDIAENHTLSSRFK